VFRNRELAEIFGTPLYVYDLDRVAASYRDLRNALPPGLMIFYSLKANRTRMSRMRCVRSEGGEPAGPRLAR
jgi:diaminopimelate decarboxylase